MDSIRSCQLVFSNRLFGIAPKILVAAALLLAGFHLPSCAVATWVNVTNNLASLQSECGNMCMLSIVPGKDKIIAGIAQQGLWQTTDGGDTWTKLGQGAGSAVITNRPSCIQYDPNNSDIFWESGIYNGGGIYKTTDGGETFKQLGDFGHNDFLSIDFTDPQRLTMVAGGHEQSQRLMKSSDGGVTWTNIGTNLPSNSAFSSLPVVLSATEYLVGCAGWGSAIPGIFHTTDGGATWTNINGNAVGAPPLFVDSVMYWPKQYGGALFKSTDKGLHWISLTASNTQGGRVIQVPDGRFVTTGPNRLLASATGSTWTQICTTCPFQPNGVVYSTIRQAFYIWYSTCATGPIPPNAIMRQDMVITDVKRPLSGIKPSGNHNRSVFLTNSFSIRTMKSLCGPEIYSVQGQIINKRQILPGNSVLIIKTKESVK